MLVSGPPFVGPDEDDVVQVGGEAVVESRRVSVLNVPALHPGPTEDLLDLAVPPLVAPLSPHRTAHPVLLPGPGSPSHHPPCVSHQPGPLPPGFCPVADVEDRVGEVNPDVHHLAALVLTLVHRQVYLVAAQSPEVQICVRVLINERASDSLIQNTEAVKSHLS